MVPGWSPTKTVQMVLIGCISRSWVYLNYFQVNEKKPLWELKEISLFIGFLPKAKVLYEYSHQTVLMTS